LVVAVLLGRKSPVIAYVVVGVGALLVITGIALTFIQLLRPQVREPMRRGVRAEFGKAKLGLKTTFPGLVLVAFGVVLVIVGVLVR
jgi:hypothetical protein